MALTRPKIWDLDTTVEYFADPITVLHQGSTQANVDVGFLFNRANGLVSNVALYWNESTQSFVAAYTSGSGTTNTNVSVTSYANVTTGNLSANGSITVTNGVFWANGTAFSSGATGTTYISTGAGNVTISGNTINLTPSGPGTTTVGSSTAIPVITPDAYGRLSVLSTAVVVAPAGTLTGTTLASGVTASSLTSVGVLTGLTTSGTIIAATLNAATIGNTGATLTGTISTASQPSITTLAGLTSFGTSGVNTTAAGNLIVSGNLTVNGTTTTINNTVYETTEYVTTINATNVNSATIGNIGANHVGTGTYLTALNASNLTSGTVPSAQISGSYTGITAVGTLVSLSSNGIVTFTNSTNNNGLAFNNGALQVTGGTGIGGNLYVAGNITVAGNINTTSGNINLVSVTGNSAQFFGNAAGFGALYDGINSGYVYQAQTVLQNSTNFNGYAQVNNQNINSGNQATTDYVLTADTGTANTNYVDLGIASSGYVNTNPNNSLGTSLYPLDGYLYVQSNVAGSPGGNLTVGTSVPGTVVRVLVGGVNIANVVTTYTSSGLTVNAATASTSTTTGALVVTGGAGIGGALYAGSLQNTPIGSTTASTGAFTTLSASSTVTLSGGTANGVLYLNGSKVATSGSGLTFDGTHLGVGTSSPGYALQLGSGSGLPQAYISGSGYDLALGASGGAIFGYASGAISTVFNTASVPLGVGTNAAQPLILGTSATERARIDTSGNFGLGITPWAWYPSYYAIDIGSWAAFAVVGGSSYMGFNSYVASGTGAFTYKNSGTTAAGYRQGTSGHIWYVTNTSGTAGNTISSFAQGMTLDNSGNLNAVGAITQNGNQVLHAGNYTSYAPSLTGTGASGNWGINITGSAPAGTLTGTTLASGVTASSLTSVGTLTGLTTSGTIIAATLNAATIGNIGANHVGTISTASQPSITTLAGLTSFGTSGVTAAAQGNLTIGTSGGNSIVATGNVWHGNLFATGLYWAGNGVVMSTGGGGTTYTSTGAGNVTISGSTINLTASGPGTTTVGSSTAIPVITPDAYGRLSVLGTAAVVAPAGTLTGSTLASGVTASSLTSVGTLTGLTSSGTVSLTGTAPQLSLSNGSSNWVNFGTSGVGAPTFTTRSAGSKLVLYENIGASSAGYAIGIDAGTMWFGTESTGHTFNWYQGTTSTMTLTTDLTLTSGKFVGAGTGLTGTASSLSIGGSAPAGSLTGTTLASGVTASSLTSLGSGFSAGSYFVAGSNVLAGYYQDATNGAYRSLNGAVNSGYYFQNYSGSSTSMYVGLTGTYAGSVGIGTTTPSSTLQVAGTVTASSFSGAGTGLTGTAASLSIGGAAPAGSLTGTTLASGVTASSLTSVGTLTSLKVNGGGIYGGTQGYTKFTSTTGDILLDNGTTDTPGVHFYYGNNTNFGIDVASSTLRFTYNLDETGGTTLVTLSSAGAFSVTGSITASQNVTAYSDENLKKNWRLVGDNFVEKLSKIKSGIYDRIDIDLTQAGVSAQSLQKVLPETVTVGESGLLSVAYGNAAMVSVVELAKEIVLLKEQNAIFKEQISTMQQLINTLINK